MTGDEVQDVFSRWTNLNFLVHYLRCTSPNRAETLRPTFLVNRQKYGRGFPTEAWVTLPLPLAADVAMLVREHGVEKSARARKENEHSAGRNLKFCDGTWAAFPGDCAATFVPLAKFQQVRKPELSDPAGTLAWHRYYNTEPPPTAQLLEHFRRELATAADGHKLVAAREWDNFNRIANRGICVSFVTPTFLRRSLGKWFAKEKDLGNRALHLSEGSDLLPEYGEGRMPLSSYLLGFGPNTEAAAHAVLARAVRTPPGRYWGPLWFGPLERPAGPHRLCPPQVVEEAAWARWARSGQEHQRGYWNDYQDWTHREAAWQSGYARGAGGAGSGGWWW